MIGARTALVLALAAAALGLTACGGGGDEEEPAPVEQAAPLEQQVPESEPEPLPEEPTAEPEPEAAPPEPDPDRGLLAYGESLEASLETVGEERQFRFEGSEQDLVRIVIDGKDGMDPIVTLLEPNRTEIVTNDDISSSNRDSLIVARLPSSGLQVVRVSAFEESIGRFVISVELVPPDDDDDSRVLVIGDRWQGVLGEPGDVDVFEFAGDADQFVRIRVDGATGTDTLAEVFGPDGTFLFRDDDSGHALDAEIVFALPQTGAYRVDVTSVGNRIGAYEFSVDLAGDTPAALLSDIEALEAVAVTYLAALQGGDALTLFALAGPEALDIWGWESPEDVSASLDKVQSVGVFGETVEFTSTIEGARGRVSIVLDVPGEDEAQTLRFDLANVNGQWLVDFVQRLFIFIPES